MQPYAQDLIAAEVERQDAMCGASNERADVSGGQMMEAATAHIIFVAQCDGGDEREKVLADTAEFYPEDWSGFRDYGSNVANLVVAAAFLQQEIKRRLARGDSYDRKSRNTMTQPYLGSDQPAVILP